MPTEAKQYTFDEFYKEHSDFHGCQFISPVNDKSLRGYSARVGVVSRISPDLAHHGFYIELTDERLLINGKTRICDDRELCSLYMDDFPGVKEDHQIILRNGCRFFLK